MLTWQGSDKDLTLHGDDKDMTRHVNSKDPTRHVNSKDPTLHVHNKDLLKANASPRSWPSSSRRHHLMGAGRVPGHKGPRSAEQPAALPPGRARSGGCRYGR
ncbi:hypothetical protein GCM10022251_65710 [Phytohabitans flavus]|uniref:Uncharacterized protein n=1 Tax=Phytohabitans flavus TaxID=1076124 RepID=A0A6F8XII7_9ACTN|nr:hypothetical protein Pflav_000270 [Phytohabitans flavus]